jgi:hypothetical protein
MDRLINDLLSNDLLFNDLLNDRLLTIFLQFLERATEADLATHLPQAIIGLRRGQQLQSSPDRLGNPGSAGLLRLLKKAFGNFHRDFARCFYH